MSAKQGTGSGRKVFGGSGLCQVLKGAAGAEVAIVYQTPPKREGSIRCGALRPNVTLG